MATREQGPGLFHSPGRPQTEHEAGQGLRSEQPLLTKCVFQVTPRDGMAHREAAGMAWLPVLLVSGGMPVPPGYS